MIMGFKKISVYTLILIFTFFSAFAINVVFVDFSPSTAEEIISSNESNTHADSPKNSFLFLDEIHHEEALIYAPMNFYVVFSNKLDLYRNPYLNTPAIPPHV